MKIEIKLDYARIRQIEQAAKDSAIEAMESVHEEIQDTVPLDQGIFLNSIYVDSAEMDDGFHVWLDHDMIYARYLYMGLKMVDRETGKGPALVHDENGGIVGLRFRKGAKLKVKQPEEKLDFKNGRTDHWLEPYITGDKKDFVQAEFTKIFKRRAGL